MPCDTTIPRGMTLAQRSAQVSDALARLKRSLLSGAVKVQIGPTGAVAFAGWTPEQRASITDVCAYRTLSVQGSYELRMAVERAERMSGRKVNEASIAAGHHTHDGNKWHRGH